MKKISSLLLLALSLNSFGQEINFVPKWKKGDTRKVIIKSETRKNKKNSSELEIESKDFEAKLKVKEVESDHYIIDLVYKDFYLNLFNKVNKSTGTEPKTFDKLNLQFKINKDGSDADLLNWEDARNVMKKTFESSLDGLIDKYGKDGNEEKNGKDGNDNKDVDTVKKIFSPLLKMWDSKEMMESYFDDEIKALIIPFQDSFSTDTVKSTKLAHNPFGKSKNDSISSTRLSWINSKNGDTYTLGTTDVVDMTEFSNMMKGVMKTLLGGFLKMMPDTNSTKYREKKAELDQMLDQIHFDIDVKESLTFDDKTSFVKIYRRDTKSEGSMMGKAFKTTGWVQIEFE